MLPLYSLATGLAVKSAVERYAAESGLNPCLLDLKWPNDIIISGRKVAGILLESVNRERQCDIIVGIGINISFSEEDFPDELQSIAGSLQQFYGGEWDRKRLLRLIAGYLEERLRNFDIARTVKDFRNESRMWGKHCVVMTGDSQVEGICRDIGGSGELILETVEGERRFFSGSLKVDWN